MAATCLPQTRRNWVAVAVRMLGGVLEAARVANIKPRRLKRWYGRGWVELVDDARTLARLTGLSVIRLVGFGDMPSLGKRRGRVPRTGPHRRGPRVVVTFATETPTAGDRPRGRIASRGPGRSYVGRANW